jgi:hypothetical protein
MISPANTKNGMANKEKLSKPVAMRWAMVVADGKAATVTSMVKKLDKPKLQATGTPSTNKVTKLMTKIKIDIHSMASSFF